MARSSVLTGLPLNQWAEIMGISSPEFNQIGNGIDYHREAQCDTVFYQYSWQRKFISRHEIAQSILRAENALANLLGFYPSARYILDENVPYPATSWSSLPSYLGPAGQWKPVKTRFAYLRNLGTIKRTLISAGLEYVTEDRDGDGVKDTFVLTVATAETDISQLALYHTSDHRSALDETWRIIPLDITADGTNATFTGSLFMLTRPILAEKPNPDSLNATITTIYVSELDVYKVETDTSDIGTSHWSGYYGVSNTQGTIDSGSPIIDTESGWFRPIVASSSIVRASPDYLRINYLAGYPLDSTFRMQEPFASMVAYLACQYMPAKKCGCERSDQIFNFWRSLPTDGESGQGRPITIEEINLNPLGQTRGALYAWNHVKLQQSQGGVLA